jgi:ubiquinone/menaquinone biosynthesis C-methylase UbiE
MKPESTDDIFELLDGYVTSAVLGTALESGIFWLLAAKPLPVSEIAQSLGIPLNRCHNWLQILCKLGLLEDTARGYVPTNVARQTILRAYSQATWAFLAREERYRFPAVGDLAVNISKPASTWEVQNLKPPNYFQRILEDPAYAAGFTRMLYEIHISLADQLANVLDMQGAKRLMDLGGGSGVVSFALLRKHPELTSVLIDIESVCIAGREIALENGLEKRITYLAADFLQDDLPTGFDLVMFCDGSSFSEALFRKIHAVLNPNGRLVIVEQLAPDQSHATPSHLKWTFLSSLEYPAGSVNFTTSEIVQARLQQAGFRHFSTTPVPCNEHPHWNAAWMILEAHK